MSGERHWDAVVIGTGFGGSTTALRLAQAGKSVLVLERGSWVDRDDSAWNTKAIHIDRKYKGHVPFEADQVGGREMVHPNHTVGGSSVFYGAASFRLREKDFKGRSSFSHVALDSAFVDWPITYDDLAPFYDEAESRLGVVGVAGIDPNEPARDSDYCGAPPPFALPAQRMADAATALGLRPFPIPLAINFEGNGSTHHNGNRNSTKCIKCLTCDLYPCKIGAKNDISLTILPQAVEHGAVVRDRQMVIKLVRAGRRITGVQCIDLRTNEVTTVHSDLVVVSGGAIASPALLLASGLGDVGPNGRLIGRYLMRHCSGIVVGFYRSTTNPERQFHKQIAITDYYFGDANDGKPAEPWGMIQGLQVPPPEFMQTTRFPVNVVGPVSSRFNIFLMCIAEDMPRFENHVSLHTTDRDQYGQPIARVRYHNHKDDTRRRGWLYKKAVKLQRKAGAFAWVRLPVTTFSHALGTCRMGSDPKEAVLDPNCNFFGIPNLFVVDSSFMPTSGGVNPSLTIAAQGLRVGTHIAEHWDVITNANAK